MKLLLKKVFLPVLSFIPGVVLAANMPTDFKGLIGIFIDLIKAIIPVLSGIALLVFFWGISKFILNAGGGKEQEEAKNTMFWGVVALFLMVSFWGIIRMLQNSFLP
jgi:succinate dehydrogenase/fumarate reductase cytochrome b subunit